VGPASAVANTAVLYDGTTGKLIKSMTDPGSDKILFWDDSAGTLEYLTLGTNLSITGTTINASGGGGSGAMTFITSVTASASATLDITGLGDYAVIKFILVNIVPGTIGDALWFRTSTNNGSTFDNGASDYRYSYSGYPSSGTSAISGNSIGSTQIVLTNGAGVATVSLEGEINLYNPAGTTYFKRIIGQVGYFETSIPSHIAVNVSGVRAAAADIDAVRFLFSTGTITGTVYVYGVSKT
jgi:hypothetical protein